MRPQVDAENARVLIAELVVLLEVVREAVELGRGRVLLEGEALDLGLHVVHAERDVLLAQRAEQLPRVDEPLVLEA